MKARKPSGKQLSVSTSKVQQSLLRKEVEMVKLVKALFRSFVDPSSNQQLYVTPDDATGCGQMNNEIKFNLPKNPDGLISVLLTQNAQYPVAVIDRNITYSDFTLRAHRRFSPDGIKSDILNGALTSTPISTNPCSNANFQMDWHCDEYPIQTRDYYNDGSVGGGVPSWSVPLGITTDASTVFTVDIDFSQDVTPGNKTIEVIYYNSTGSVVYTVASSPSSGTSFSLPYAVASVLSIGHMQIRLAATSATDWSGVNNLNISIGVANSTGRAVVGPTFYTLIPNPSFSSLASKGRNYLIRSKSGLISFRGNDNYGGSIAYRQLDSAYAEVPFGGVFDYDYTASLQDAYDGILETGCYAFWQPLDLVRDLSYHNIYDSILYSPLMVFAGNQDTTSETLRCVVELLIQYTTLSDSEKPIIPQINYEAFELAIGLLAKFNPGSENPNHMTRINKAMGHINKFAGHVESGLHTAGEIVKIVGSILATLAAIAV